MGTRGECDGEVVEVSISLLEELSPTGVDQNRYVTICESTKTKRAKLKLKHHPDRYLLLLTLYKLRGYSFKKIFVDFRVVSKCLRHLN